LRVPGLVASNALEGAIPTNLITTRLVSFPRDAPGIASTHDSSIAAEMAPIHCSPLTTLMSVPQTTLSSTDS
jgi:hypothetical protein